MLRHHFSKNRWGQQVLFCIFVHLTAVTIPFPGPTNQPHNKPKTQPAKLTFPIQLSNGLLELFNNQSYPNPNPTKFK